MSNNTRLIGAIEVGDKDKNPSFRLIPLTLTSMTNGVEFRGNGQEFFIPWDFVLSAASALRDELSKYNSRATCPCCGSAAVQHVAILWNGGGWDAKDCATGEIVFTAGMAGEVAKWVKARPHLKLIKGIFGS